MNCTSHVALKVVVKIVFNNWQIEKCNGIMGTSLF